MTLNGWLSGLLTQGFFGLSITAAKKIWRCLFCSLRDSLRSSGPQKGLGVKPAGGEDWPIEINRSEGVVAGPAAALSSSPLGYKIDVAIYCDGTSCMAIIGAASTQS